MIENENEILNLRNGFQQSSDDLRTAVDSINQIATNTNDLERRSELKSRARTVSNSSRFALYDNLIKNCNKVVDRPDLYPQLNVSYNPQSSSFAIAGNPQTTKYLNEVFPSLYGIATEPSEIVSDQGENIKPCFGSARGVAGHTMTFELGKKTRKPDLSDVPLPDYSQDQTIDHCIAPECRDCEDCAVHKSLMYDTLKGLAKGPSGMKQLHLKNLMTILGSWGAHQDSRGGDRTTEDDYNYQSCRLKHEIFGTAMSLMARRLISAHQKEGGRHRDWFPGRGKREAAY